MTARPEQALLITPGAGHDRDQSSLVAIEAALVVHGYAVERMDFPYRRAGRKAPDRAPVLIEAVVDPYEPPMPPSVTIEQALHFAESLAKGEPNRKKIALTVVEDKVREMV